MNLKELKILSNLDSNIPKKFNFAPGRTLL